MICAKFALSVTDFRNARNSLIRSGPGTQSFSEPSFPDCAEILEPAPVAHGWDSYVTEQFVKEGQLCVMNTFQIPPIEIFFKGKPHSFVSEPGIGPRA